MYLPAVPEAAQGDGNSAAGASDRAACIPAVWQPLFLTKDLSLGQEAVNLQECGTIAVAEAAMGPQELHNGAQGHAFCEGCLCRLQTTSVYVKGHTMCRQGVQELDPPREGFVKAALPSCSPTVTDLCPEAVYPVLPR